MQVFEERGKLEDPGKRILRAEKRTNRLNPHKTQSLKIEPGSHWWEASALTTTALQKDFEYSMITVVLLSASAVVHEEPAAPDSQVDNPVANEHPWSPPEITGRGIIPMASEEELEELQDMVDELLNSDGNDNQSGQGRVLKFVGGRLCEKSPFL